MPTIRPRNYRERLRAFLNDQLTLMEDSKSVESSLLGALLEQAAEGLRALDYGEVQSIFVPDDKKGSKDGTKPYTLRKLRMKALGFADLLIAKNYEGDEPAIRTVAGAYGEQAAAFRKWRIRPKLGKTTDSLMKSFREEISTKHDWDEVRVIAELKKAGETYKREKKRAAYQSKNKAN
jgi:hypothetical protein